MNSNKVFQMFRFGIFLNEILKYGICRTELANSTEFYRKYILTCGFGYLCNTDLENSMGFETVATDLGPCPPCFCDDDCLTRNDCCPDLLYENKPWTKCWATSQDDLVSVEYPLVKHCPADAVRDDHVLCSETIFTRFPPLYPFRFVPVNSNRTRISYKNIYCALCHGEDARDLEKWDIFISPESCSNDSYHQQIAMSYAMLADYRIGKLCPTWFVPKPPIEIPRCPRTEKIKISKCNVDGTWQLDSFNVDIDRACSSGYGPPFRLYSNVFCFICNPPRIWQPLISHCSEDTRKTTTGIQLEILCRTHESISASYPYKNVFCYLCNLRQQNGVFAKSFSTITQEFQYYGSIIYTYNNTKLLHGQDLLAKIAEHNKTIEINVTEERDPAELLLNGRIYNLSSLLLTRVLASPTKICNKNLLPDLIRDIVSHDCSCDPSCLFDNKCSCCVDTALSYPLSCFRDSFVVTNGCYGNKNREKPYFSAIRSLCEQNSLLDYPIKSGFIDYKNVFCFLCNTDYDVVNETLILPLTDHVVRGFMVKCRDIIPISYSISIDDILKHARDYRCDISFSTQSPWCRSCGKNYYPTCNTFPGSSDLAGICHEIPVENFAPYLNRFRNEFCYFCYLEANVIGTVENCSVGLDTSFEQACRSLPASYSPDVYPFKNSFCKMCSTNCSQDCDFGLENNVLDCYGSTGAIGIIDPPTLRSIFGMPGKPEPKDTLHIPDTLMNTTSIFDQVNNIHRPLLCYPGRFLDNDDACVLPRNEEKAGEYVILTETTGGLLNNVEGNGRQTLKTLKQVYTDELSTFLRSEFYFLRVLKMFVNISCFDEAMGAFHVATKVIVSPKDIMYTDLSHLERKLFLISDAIRNRTRLRNMTTTELTVSKFTKADMVSTTNPSSQQCRYILEDAYLSFYSPVTILAGILKCKHVEFGPEEYKVDINGVVTVFSPVMTLQPGNYVIRASNAISFCLDDFLAINKPLAVRGKLMEQDEILRWLTLSTTLLSLLCLVLTFVVYCKFAVLRTLPGKNLMVLILNLFLAQFFFTMGNNMTENPTVCVVIGIIQHFCWLSMLCSFTVYCFHTFRVFHTLQARPSFTPSLFVKYVAVTYSTPALLVAATIAISFAYFEDIGYGGQICFLSHTYLRFGGFLIPIVLAVIVNFIFLVVVMFKIVSAKQVQSSNQERNNVIIFFKLFAISGGLWGFQIIDGIFESSAFSYIISILNCFQGLFIFVSFVLNKRTIQLILKTSSLQNDSSNTKNSTSRIKGNQNVVTCSESIGSASNSTRM